jgi:hypothetical protein
VRKQFAFLRTADFRIGVNRNVEIITNTIAINDCIGWIFFKQATFDVGYHFFLFSGMQTENDGYRQIKFLLRLNPSFSV